MMEGSPYRESPLKQLERLQHELVNLILEMKNNGSDPNQWPRIITQSGIGPTEYINMIEHIAVTIPFTLINVALKKLGKSELKSSMDKKIIRGQIYYTRLYQKLKEMANQKKLIDNNPEASQKYLENVVHAIKQAGITNEEFLAHILQILNGQIAI